MPGNLILDTQQQSGKLQQLHLSQVGGRCHLIYDGLLPALLVCTDLSAHQHERLCLEIL